MSHVFVRCNFDHFYIFKWTKRNKEIETLIFYSYTNQRVTSYGLLFLRVVLIARVMSYFYYWSLEFIVAYKL